jgi:DNA-binding MarR family transcriptional regulator
MAGKPIATERLGRDFSTAVVLFHEAIAARLGISSAEWKCLGLLEEHGPLTAGRLAELSGFTTGAITGIVDRLERAGYAGRERHPEDRRSVIVRPLRLGEVRARVAPVFAALGRAMQAVTRRYRRDELAVIADYLERVTRVLREQTAGLGRGERSKS